MRFPVRYNTFSILITIGSLLLLFKVLVFDAWKNWEYPWIGYSIFIVFGILVPILLMPYAYFIKEDKLIIRRFIFSIKVKASEIDLVRRIEKAEMKYTWRTWGNGGYFGFYGYFTNNALKDFRMYTGGMKDLILIKTITGKQIVISGQEELYNALKNFDSTQI